MGDEPSQGTKKSVPKFVSFRSKPQTSSKGGASKDVEKIVLSASADTAFKDSLPQETNYRHRERQEYHSSRNRSHHRNRSAKEREQSLLQPSPVVEPIPWEEARGSFLVDKVGDPNNLTYGALDRHAIPNYIRSGGGSVLGSTPSYKIDRFVSGEKFVVLSGHRYSLPNKREKNAFSKLNRIGIRKLRIRSNDYHDRDSVAAVDFISLKLARGKSRKHGGNGNTSDSSASLGEDDGHYRSIDRETKTFDRLDDEDLLYGSNTSTSDYEGGHLDHFDEVQQRTRKGLVRKTEAEPTSGDAWLEMINHSMLGISLESKTTIAEIHSIADVKISIYEKAIESVLDPKAREKLIMGLMEEGSKIWDISKISSKWRYWLRTHPEYLGLWTKHLDYIQTTFPSFRFSETRSVYNDCLSMLQRARSRPTAGAAESNILYENQIYVLLRMTIFMREAGFTENAIAAWQATLEWQISKPSAFRSREYTFTGCKASEALSAFEEFWDSEVPRIGEKGSQGWDRFTANNGEPADSRKDSDFIPEDGAELPSAWAKLEHRRALECRVAARTTDEVDEGDPYRVILFSDVRSSLIDPLASSSGLAVLFQALLVFCHLPPFPIEHARKGPAFWWGDPFLRNEVLHQSNQAFTAWGLKNKSESKNSPRADEPAKDLSLNASDPPNPFSFLIPDYQISLDSLFATYGTWFSAFDAWQHEYSQDRGPVETAWIRRMLKAIVQCAPSEEYLGEYYLAFEMSISPETVKKVARGLMKTRPDSLRLYNVYALIEYRLGNTSGAESVFATAINMAKGLQEAAQRDAVILWRTWIWELLDSGQRSRALGRLLLYSEDAINVTSPELGVNSPRDHAAISPFHFLRTQTALTISRDHLLSFSLLNHAVILTDLLVLLAYLTTSSLPSALSTFHQNLKLYPPSSATHEFLHQSFSRLLYHHTTQTPSFSPSTVRSSLAESIKAYPKNTIFLSLYTWIESRFSIDDRVRSIIKDVVLTSHTKPNQKEDRPSIVSHFFAIYTELRRSLTLGSNINTVRAAFERAVREGSIGVHSVGLWKLYFWFERERADRKKAKEVYWRGIRACPWAKDLYMLAFDCERKAGIGMGEVELRGVIEMMERKELRIHMGIDDIKERLMARRELSA